MKALQSLGFKRPRLDETTVSYRNTHSAIQDTKQLREVVKTYLKADYPFTYTLTDILQYMNKKMPLQVPRLNKLAT